MRLRGRGGAWLGGVVVGVGLLFLPEANPQTPALPEGGAFVWDQDELFRELERTFAVSRKAPCPDNQGERIAALRVALGQQQPFASPGDEKSWAAVEREFFQIAATMGSCPDQLDDLLALRNELRGAVKSLGADQVVSPAARDRMYRLLYGTRIAVEELLLQLPEQETSSLSIVADEPSATPSTVIQGVTVHSGDLLLSRGGAPTSAFIARGSDYPGNFSHVALLHIDEQTKKAVVIEAHIESGVGLSTVEKYLEDKKLRILVLRLRADLPAMKKDQLLPHRAAALALESAVSRHIPYDFAMDVEDASAQFCSEVASSAYREQGVTLWKMPSRFSSPGLARWMASLGVEHLETHGPSDLEYDPDLRVVAEWHDRKTLFFDHIDNAVIDVMLEYAEAGTPFAYDAEMLPLARLGKAYSWLLNQVGAVGPVPEGMSATTALRVQWLTGTHEAIRADVEASAEQFAASKGYTPPYWQLVALAENAAKSHLGKLPAR